MNRTLPIAFALCFGFSTTACKSDSDTKTDRDPATPPPAPGASSNPNAAAPTAEEMKTNPIEGIEAPTPILEAGAFTDGPVWHPGMGVLFFATPLGNGALFRMLPDGRVLRIREGNRETGTQPIGNTVLTSGDIVTVEAKRIVRSAPAGGDVTVIATGYTGVDRPPPDPLDPNAAAPAMGDGKFDTLNDVVARKDGTLYVTDPGYFAEPTSNRLYRIDPQGKVQVVESFADVPRPNGIVLSPDEKTLYVGFSAPLAGTLPFVRKYIVNDDGTLGEWTKFVDLGPADSTPDGLAVDKVGNVYAATRAGIEVFKPDGTSWGIVQIPEKPTGMSFGGEDMKTLYVTTEGVKIWQFRTKLSGLSQ